MSKFPDAQGKFKGQCRGDPQQRFHGICLEAPRNRPGESPYKKGSQPEITWEDHQNGLVECFYLFILIFS